MPEHWSLTEVAATVADYLGMLELELRNESYNKREHNRQLQAVLKGRSATAIEYKHGNISAVMIELGFPYIEGYKPRSNYQDLLRQEVLAQLAQRPTVEQVTAAVVEAPATSPAAANPEDIFVPPPTRNLPRAARERFVSPTIPQRINYLEREARNRSLGLAGEEFVVDLERRRLWDLGAKKLSNRVDHVSVTQGDGLGFDILSFESDGAERLIEVKTTAFGPMTPFFASAREIALSRQTAGFHLYRVFRFRDGPRVFTLAGSLQEHFVLDPISFRATIG